MSNKENLAAAEAKKHLPVGPLVELTLEQFLALYDPEVHDRLREVLNREGTAGLVDCENVDFCSSQFGRRTALAVGPGCTYKTWEEMEGKWLGQLVSDRRYAKHYVRRIT